MANKHSGRRFYTMYHGTSVNAAYSIINNGFQVSLNGMLGRGVYISKDVRKASKYPGGQVDKVVLKLSVRVGKVKKIDRQDHPLRLTWHDHGYDSAWVPPGCGMVPSGQEEDCVYDPWRIKVTDVVRVALQNSTTSPPMTGRFYTMYHGTLVNSAYSIIQHGFRVSEDGMLGRGVYVSRDIEKASKYPLGHGDHEKVVLQLNVRVGKVKRIDSQDHPLRLTWHDKGYDSAWVPPGCGMVNSNQEEDCIYDPSRIKVIDVVKGPPEHVHSLRHEIGNQ
ncbi:uncharacterized protein LOC122926289 [Bufo gargarizans]|uniref:uncharacterized protein LOC122926289 n=1 Tax=Bufo gargarizans TaxID=30331 RepID=UPI001CF4A312|nr:uncharacterized protein LOC122926289 [Bufo gargarizans]